MGDNKKEERGRAKSHKAMMHLQNITYFVERVQPSKRGMRHGGRNGDRLRQPKKSVAHEKVVVTSCIVEKRA